MVAWGRQMDVAKVKVLSLCKLHREPRKETSPDSTSAPNMQITSHRKISKRPTRDWNLHSSCCEATSEHLSHPGGNHSTLTKLIKKYIKKKNEKVEQNLQVIVSSSITQLTWLNN